MHYIILICPKLFANLFMVSTVTLTRCKNTAIFNYTYALYAETARHMYYMEIGNGHFFQKLSLSYNFSAF